MAKDNSSNNTEVEDALPTELDALKKRATLLNIRFHPSIGLAKLRVLVDGALKDEPEKEEKEPKKELSAKSKETAARIKSVKDASKLVRIRVACMNPAKKEWPGELFTVSNSVVGTHRKFVPFNNEEGWHVPAFILSVMRERQCQIFVTQVGKDGAKLRKGKLIREFNIEVLPELSLKELEELAQRQALGQTID
jgi:hypothetical protein